MKTYLVDVLNALEPKKKCINFQSMSLPNRMAFEFDKVACLTWRMAGGVEPDDEYCSDNDFRSTGFHNVEIVKCVSDHELSPH